MGSTSAKAHLPNYGRLLSCGVYNSFTFEGSPVITDLCRGELRFGCLCAEAIHNLALGVEPLTTSNHSYDFKSLELDQNGAALVVARPRA